MNWTSEVMRNVHSNCKTTATNRARGREVCERAARGSVLIYSFFSIAVMLGIAVLAVDLGRVQVAKTELQAATDAAVRAAGQKMLENGSTGEILAAAVGAANENKVDGKSVVVRAQNVKFGVYDTNLRRFFETADPTYSNAIRIELTHQFGRESDRLNFANIFSSGEKTITHRATVLFDDAPGGWDSTSWERWVPGTTTGNSEEVLTEANATAYFDQIKAERERLEREEEERRHAEWMAAEAKRIAERDAYEAANPWAKVERLEREERERIAWEEEQRRRAEEERNHSESTEGHWERGGTTTPAPAPPRRMTQVE